VILGESGSRDPVRHAGSRRSLRVRIFSRPASAPARDQAASLPRKRRSHPGALVLVPCTRAPLRPARARGSPACSWPGARSPAGGHRPACRALGALAHGERHASPPWDSRNDRAPLRIVAWIALAEVAWQVGQPAARPRDGIARASSGTANSGLPPRVGCAASPAKSYSTTEGHRSTASAAGLRELAPDPRRSGIPVGVPLRSPAQPTPLRTRNYRLYSSGQVISVPGTWLQTVAQAWLVLQLSASGGALGVTVALQTVPVLVLGAWTGSAPTPSTSASCWWRRRPRRACWRWCWGSGLSRASCSCGWCGSWRCVWARPERSTRRRARRSCPSSSRARRCHGRSGSTRRLSRRRAWSAPGPAER